MCVYTLTEYYMYMQKWFSQTKKKIIVNFNENKKIITVYNIIHG